MKHYIYPRLAVNGIRKNKRLYIPYILTCIGMVMMFYIISFLSSSSTIAKLNGGSVLQSCLVLGCGVIGLFSLVFLFYTNSFLIRRRKKEFGLYNILGMGKWNLAGVLLWESLIIMAISILGGLFCGILFSKFAELLMVNILHAEIDFSLTVEPKAVELTVILFVSVFILLLFNTLRQIQMSEPIELLRSENTGEKPPKVNWMPALIGAALLIGAYALAVSIKGSVEAMFLFFVAVIMVIIATYLLFISGSVALCRMLQKNKNYYYKTNHFVSVSSMVFRMKRNGAGLASICILCTMVLVMLSSTLCLYIGAEDNFQKRYPRTIFMNFTVSEMADMNSDSINSIINSAESTAEEYGQTPENMMNYDMVTFFGNINGNKIQTSNVNDFTKATTICIVSLEDYNVLMNENEALSENEVLIYTSKGLKYKADDINLEGGLNFKIKKTVDTFVDNPVDIMNIMPSMFIFVPDLESAVQPLSNLADFSGNRLPRFYHYYGYDLNCDDEQQLEIYNAFSDKLHQQIDNGETAGMSISLDCAAMDRVGFYELYGSLFFLGILLGIVFVFAAVLIIYYKQISEGYEDQSRFEIMQKVGMNKKEIRKSINSQVLTVFFLPLLMSAMHLGFAFPLMYKILMLFAITDLMLIILITLGCFAVFAFFYIVVYKITSKAYYTIVSGAKN